MDLIKKVAKIEHLFRDLTIIVLRSTISMQKNIEVGYLNQNLTNEIKMFNGRTIFCSNHHHRERYIILVRYQRYANLINLLLITFFINRIMVEQNNVPKKEYVLQICISRLRVPTRDSAFMMYSN